ncbi:TonB-dependent receptor plug domain-containing protein [Niabella yanshanensis]|uniref:TonB-dependent receptor plug domain-containing protein n=1 Tax=Niabella yanshanensis TaxID=577386 RepID=A0ABZ0W9B7_9BACT|nr:TonB-dependent receptor plug domain-containing protein [Niabella yanshanensis]WQD39862.1 TonB-dependent receptor plug domain-containing protein [Niabella yanshanensis]
MRIVKGIGLLGNIIFQLFLIGCSIGASAQTRDTSDTSSTVDSLILTPTIGIKYAKVSSANNKLILDNVTRNPYISVQQYIKGNAAGTYIQEPTGEPGVAQNVFIHGLSAPLLNKKYLYDQQPAVYVNGLPLLTDNPFAYDIQKYDFNRIGPATNLMTIVDADNIESIEILKNPLELASLGPIASNGAIWITTKKSSSFDLSINSYYGIVAANRVTPINASYENQFRQQFYNKYGTLNDALNYPQYLRDSTNNDYYGAANWTDEYYKTAALYNANFGISAGTDRANYRFFGSMAKNANSADNTSISKYGANFMLNVAPLEWLMVSSMISYNRLERQRNRSIRDRLAEQRYIPDLANPLTPNKDMYSAYLSQFDKRITIDKNANNALEGYLALEASLKGFHYLGKIGFDYNEGLRDVFWPSTLLETNNFTSAYFGYNQRLITNHSLDYSFDFSNDQRLKLGVLQSFNSDIYRYNYAYAYNTPNDFIKSVIVNGDRNAGDYLEPPVVVHYFPSKMRTALFSLGGNATYELSDILSVNALIRRDGSSAMPVTHKWFTGYGAGANWDIKNHLMKERDGFSAFSLNAAWSRLGKTFSDDRYQAGPQYRVDLGWGNEPTIGSYAGIAGLSRPYTTGWVGYDIPWSYVDKLQVGAMIGFMQDRLTIGLDIYNKDDKNGLFPVPVAAEWGYISAYKSGLHVNNKGVDLTVKANLVRSKASDLYWDISWNANYNKNVLKALPGGFDEIVIGDNKLKVGEAADQFWILQNAGIYNNTSEIPAGLTVRGVPVKVGDAKWVDVNSDNTIDNEDKVLKGNYMPKISGGLGTSIALKSFTLDVQLYYALGHKALNYYASKRMDFINSEAVQDINSVKEITYWEKKQDLSIYPVYNVWSNTSPYRSDQDIFLENLSFLKLRSLSLGYDFSKMLRGKAFKRSLLYVTGTNLLTFTKFNGDDPELVNYNGYYRGDGLPLPKSVIVGLKLDF